MANGSQAIYRLANPRILTAELKKRFAKRPSPSPGLQDYPDMIQQMAKLVLSNKPIPPFSQLSKQFPGFDNDVAYHVTAAICSTKLRSRGGAQNPVGRKIGFTNKNIWTKYNVDRSNWGYVWLNSVTHSPLEVPSIDISVEHRKTGCKLEPEIVFGLESAPSSTMSDRELLGCIKWVAHGYEVVYSPYPFWNFTIADTTATGALHKHLFVGGVTSQRLWKGQEDKFISDLQNFEIDLYRDGEMIASGKGSNVLGSPLNALRHLCEILEKQDLHPRLQAGEIVTTGTLTDAMDLNVDGEWQIKTRGLDLLEGYCSLQVNMDGVMIRKDGTSLGSGTKPPLIRKYVTAPRN